MGKKYEDIVISDKERIRRAFIDDDKVVTIEDKNHGKPEPFFIVGNRKYIPVDKNGNAIKLPWNYKWCVGLKNVVLHPERIPKNEKNPKDPINKVKEIKVYDLEKRIYLTKNYIRKEIKSNTLNGIILYYRLIISIIVFAIIIHMFLVNDLEIIPLFLLIFLAFIFSFLFENITKYNKIRIRIPIDISLVLFGMFSLLFCFSTDLELMASIISFVMSSILIISGVIIKI
jgi:hypothetical protein